MKQLKNNIFYIILFLYHFIYTLISYDYFSKNGGDANLYWFQTTKTTNKVWSDFLYPGTDFICLLNFPLAKWLQLPIWFGFALYSFIGYLAILQFAKWIKLVIPNPINYKNCNLVLLIVFLPSLHFWTSILGKEPLILLGITTFILELSKVKGNVFQIIGSLLLVALIRPHMAILLIICFVIIYIYIQVKNPKKRLIMLVSSILIFLASGVALMKISKIHQLDIDKIVRYNQFSKLSNRYADSYVPMNDYSISEQLFAFYFRPLFFDSKTILSVFVSVENLFVLILHLVSLFLLFLHWKKIALNYIYWSIILYYIVFVFVFIQRYSVLGLFVRTKIMSQPFFIVFLIYILVETYKIKKIDTNIND